MDEDFDELAETQAKAQELASVKELIGMPGWTVVSTHFKKVIQAVQECLEVEENFEKIKRLQERLRAFKAMLETVDVLCEQHSQVLLQLDDMVNDQNEREQYALNIKE